MTNIPLLSLRDGDNLKNWYPLCKRGPRSNIQGDIEIEISSTGLKGMMMLAN
jgi:hypothetical protein